MSISPLNETIWDLIVPKGVEVEGWEPQADEYYYGEIPKDTNLDELEIIITNGLIKFMQECKMYYEEHGCMIDKKTFYDVIDSTLDIWYMDMWYNNNDKKNYNIYPEYFDLEYCWPTFVNTITKNVMDYFYENENENSHVLK